MSETKETTIDQTMMITLHLKTMQWNSIFAIMGRLARTTEVKEIFEKVNAQTDGKQADEFDITLSMEQANLLLDILKMMPFYLVHDMIMEIVEQGRAEIKKAEATAQAQAEAKAQADNETNTASAE